MPLRYYRPVANGLRTDHPIPDLPFVDDSHIPVEDARELEAVGRNKGEGRWGRQDRCRDGGWVGFTTDPIRHDLAWVVRWHPLHGRSVFLHEDASAASLHVDLQDAALLFRSGGYWWDGSTWYRPAQIWDRAGEEYVRRPVRGAVTVTAADLAGAGDPDRGQLLQVIDVEVEPQPSPPQRWADDLALWARHRKDRGPLEESVVRISAPELAADQLVGMTEVAQIVGIAASTVRAYASRGESDVPQPQAVIGGRNVWARAVAEEWAEQRRSSAEGIRGALSTDRDRPSMAPGISHIWDQFTGWFFTSLWENPDRRRRFALRWRNESAVHDLAGELGWQVAASIGQLIPIDALAVTIRHAILDDMATDQQRDRWLAEHDIASASGTDGTVGIGGAAGGDGAGGSVSAEDPVFYGITPHLARMLDWLIRHDPRAAGTTIAETIGEAERRLGITRKVTADSLSTALALDGALSTEAREEFLDRVLSPILAGAGAGADAYVPDGQGR